MIDWAQINEDICNKRQRKLKLTSALFSIRQQMESFVTAAGVISRRVITELIASGENHGLV